MADRVCCLDGVNLSEESSADLLSTRTIRISLAEWHQLMCMFDLPCLGHDYGMMIGRVVRVPVIGLSVMARTLVRCDLSLPPGQRVVEEHSNA